MCEDLEIVVNAVEKMIPFSLIRFGDGESFMVRMPCPDEQQKAIHNPYESWDVQVLSQRFQKELRASLAAEYEDYCIGINCKRCDCRGHKYCVAHMKIPLRQQTFAELFGWSNYNRAFEVLSAWQKNGATLVSCSETADFQIPNDIPVNQKWKEDDVVLGLLKVKNPILVAAGPGACTIIHRYWSVQTPEKRVPILDIGAALDPIIHDGRIARAYQRTQHWGRTGGPMGPGDKNICRWPGKDANAK